MAFILICYCNRFFNSFQASMDWFNMLFIANSGLKDLTLHLIYFFLNLSSIPKTCATA